MAKATNETTITTTVTLTLDGAEAGHLKYVLGRLTGGGHLYDVYEALVSANVEAVEPENDVFSAVKSGQ